MNAAQERLNLRRLRERINPKCALKEQVQVQHRSCKSEVQIECDVSVAPDELKIQLPLRQPLNTHSKYKRYTFHAYLTFNHSHGQGGAYMT